jgi:magnesium-transporting ATPase (P-type)
MELVVLSSKSREELEKKLFEAENMKSTKSKMSIVIDGFTLTIVLEDEKLADRFFGFGCKANSVICCRVSPK